MPPCPDGKGQGHRLATTADLRVCAFFGFYEIFLPLANMAKIDELIIDKIRDAASIVDVVGEYVDLRRSGTGYLGLCPWHNDRSIGSFQVSPSKNICKCFSCGRSADPVAFVMSMEKLDFPDAIRWLGKKYSIEVDEEQKMFTNVKP